MNGLIGHSGFVGSNLKYNIKFDANYNSLNIDLIKGMEFDILICAAAPGSMLQANLDGEEDLRNIERLIENIKQCRAKKIILISTIGVFKDFNRGHNEGSDGFEDELAYGINRRYLEKNLMAFFEKVYVVRLPSIFGSNLKKNFLFDLLNPMPSFVKEERLQKTLDLMKGYERDFLVKCFNKGKLDGFYHLDRPTYNQFANKNKIETKLLEGQLSSIFFHSHKSSYQFYNLERLWDDICLIIQNDIELVHLAPPRLQVGEIYKLIYNHMMPETRAKVHHEDLKTNYHSLWSSSRPYIYSEEIILADIKKFSKLYSDLK